MARAPSPPLSRPTHTSTLAHRGATLGNRVVDILHKRSRRRHRRRRRACGPWARMALYRDACGSTWCSALRNSRDWLPMVDFLKKKIVIFILWLFLGGGGHFCPRCRRCRHRRRRRRRHHRAAVAPSNFRRLKTRRRRFGRADAVGALGCVCVITAPPDFRRLKTRRQPFGRAGAVGAGRSRCHHGVI